MPLVISLIVCSTWMRVFISRKKKSFAGDERLDRADAIVADRARRFDARIAQALEYRFRNERRRLFVEFLMPALQRAVAFADVHDVAVFVGEDLQLDVFRVVEVALDVDDRILEVRFRLAYRRCERTRNLFERPRDL